MKERKQRDDRSAVFQWGKYTSNLIWRGLHDIVCVTSFSDTLLVFTARSLEPIRCAYWIVADCPGLKAGKVCDRMHQCMGCGWLDEPTNQVRSCPDCPDGWWKKRSFVLSNHDLIREAAKAAVAANKAGAAAAAAPPPGVMAAPPGVAVAAGGAVAVTPAASVPATAAAPNFCTGCGAPFVVGANFCGQCGRKSPFAQPLASDRVVDTKISGLD